MNDQHTAPVLPVERVRQLDIIRGFALFGILLANMPFFASPVVYQMLLDGSMWTDQVSRGAEWTIQFIASSKFFTMFSFLFGLGFILFLDRAREKTAKPQSLFLRRLVFLLAIGIVHAFGIWFGDILVIYAITGLFLLLFYRREAKTCLYWAFGLLALPVVFLSLGALALYMTGEGFAQPEQSIAMYEQMVEQSIAAYGSGSFGEIMNQRTADYWFMFSNYLFMAPMILAMFLFGVYAAKSKMHTNIKEYLPFFKKVWVITLIIGLPVNFLYVNSYFEQGSDITYHSLLMPAASTIAGPALCFFYITSLILLYQSRSGKWLLNPLRAVGRTALSNYLLQSIVCTLIFYNYGFGLYAELEPIYWIVIAVVLFAFQILISNWWVARFRFGPAEWLWRSLTYSSRQSFRN
ncbi:hypothetical protein CR205_04025 [Alteribacter lacisalsi]|uniref:DUF418 domain-containing protein n=1 Tax=Alteribacter lacisalsi TaxID=2045244 RepID=A0A2W0HCV2_9BACI|nr:DUF418 domain-containing protein [Alteribacter lacisalsi]PYZ97770.1 hypothetical protein CR205_04025 [Alteribacter lacisalsi]